MSKKAIIITVVITVLGIVGIILSLIFEPKNRERRETESELVKSLITENYIDFQEYDFESEKEFKYGKKPSKNDNIILVHKKDDNWKLYSIRGLNISEIKTKEDLDKVDTIVFAISSFYSKDYQYNGSGVKVKISTEKVDLYFYNPKLNKFYINRKLPYHELPKTTNTSKDYTYSYFDIEKRINDALGIKTSSAWAYFGIFIIIVVVIVVVARVYITFRDFKRNNVNKKLKMNGNKL